MKCPNDLGRILIGIIGAGLLRIRAAAWAGDADRCAREADHIHNLPGLLQDYTFDRLKYYWDVERADYVTQSRDVSMTQFEHLWDELGHYAEETTESPRAT